MVGSHIAYEIDPIQRKRSESVNPMIKKFYVAYEFLEIGSVELI